MYYQIKKKFKKIFNSFFKAFSKKKKKLFGRPCTWYDITFAQAGNNGCYYSGLFCLVVFDSLCYLLLVRYPLKEIFFLLFVLLLFLQIFLLSILTFAISFLHSLFCQLIKSAIRQWVTHLLHTTAINFIPHSHDQHHITLAVFKTLCAAMWYGWMWKFEK